MLNEQSSNTTQLSVWKKITYLSEAQTREWTKTKKHKFSSLSSYASSIPQNLKFPSMFILMGEERRVYKLVPLIRLCQQFWWVFFRFPLSCFFFSYPSLWLLTHISCFCFTFWLLIPFTVIDVCSFSLHIVIVPAFDFSYAAYFFCPWCLNYEQAIGISTKLIKDFWLSPAVQEHGWEQFHFFFLPFFWKKVLGFDSILFSINIKLH